MKEYADFLGSQSPYDALSAEELLRLVHRPEVEYVAAGTTIGRSPALDRRSSWPSSRGSSEHSANR